MNVPCVMDNIESARCYNRITILNRKEAINMVPEGDYRRGVMYYSLKVLKDIEDDYERAKKAMEGSE